jgi:hypothetical protein
LFTDCSHDNPVSEGINTFKKSSKSSSSPLETAIDEISGDLAYMQSMFAGNPSAQTTLEALTKKLLAFASNIFKSKLIKEAIQELHFQSKTDPPPTSILLVVPHDDTDPALTSAQTEFKALRLTDPDAALEQAITSCFINAHVITVLLRPAATMIYTFCGNCKQSEAQRQPVAQFTKTSTIHDVSKFEQIVQILNNYNPDNELATLVLLTQACIRLNTEDPIVLEEISRGTAASLALHDFFDKLPSTPLKLIVSPTTMLGQLHGTIKWLAEAKYTEDPPPKPKNEAPDVMNHPTLVARTETCINLSSGIIECQTASDLILKVCLSALLAKDLGICDLSQRNERATLARFISLSKALTNLPAPRKEKLLYSITEATPDTLLPDPSQLRINSGSVTGELRAFIVSACQWSQPYKEALHAPTRTRAPTSPRPKKEKISEPKTSSPSAEWLQNRNHFYNNPESNSNSRNLPNRSNRSNRTVSPISTVSPVSSFGFLTCKWRQLLEWGRGIAADSAVTPFLSYWANRRNCYRTHTSRRR